MAVAVQEPTTNVDYVAEAVLYAYRSHVEDATHMSLAEFIDSPRSVGSIRAIVAPDSHTVEVVLDGDSETQMLAEVAWTVAGRGWHLNVLVNLARLGDAHTTLRGTPCTLQGWWFDDEMVRFSGHERP
jgi:ABC-type transport system substrate-binding protein